MKNFENGDVVEVINWSDAWHGELYKVTGSYNKFNKTFYTIDRIGPNVSQCNSGSFSAEHLRYAGNRIAEPKEFDLLKLDVPELADLITKATARIVELTKNA